MVKKNQIIEIEIEKIVPGGEGLGYYNEFAIFVPMSAIGDILKVEIISTKKTYARGLIKEIIKPSPDRIEDINKISFEDFLGADFGMLKYDAQLRYKKLIVEDVIRHIAKNDEIEIKDVVGAENPYHYRNKVIEPFAKYKGKIISGFYKRRSHEVFEVENNILNSILGNKIIDELKKILNREEIEVYNEEKHVGILRNIMVRTTSENKAMVVLIINSKKIPDKIKNILLELKNICKEIVSIYVSLNNKRTNVALGEKNILVWGDKFLKENIDGINFNISPKSFFQINLEQTKKLYNIAISKFSNIKNNNIVDAYSGTGTLGMLLSKYANKVYAIELVSSATQDGIKTSRENNIKNIDFINGKVEEKLIELIKEDKRIDSIIFDPPRKGIDIDSLNAVAKLGIKEFVYISCNPATFSRDTKILNDLGYKIDSVQPVDMFPGTSHIEVVGRFYK